MKKLTIFLFVLLTQYAFAQNNFTGINQFTIGQETYEVHHPTYRLLIRNISNNLQNTPIQADCYWYEGYDEVPLDFIATASMLENLIKSSLSHSRRQQFASKQESLEIHIKFDNQYKIKELAFDLVLNTILTREEIYNFEVLLKEKTLIKHPRRNCNFNWLFFETKIKLY